MSGAVRQYPLLSIVNGRQHCACQCHPDFSCFTFGTDSRINFSDVDGMFQVEKTGYFLYVEWKKLGETLPDAQLRVAVGLANIPGGRFTVLVIHGPTHGFVTGAEGMQVQRVRPYHGNDLKEMRRVALPVRDITGTDRAEFQGRIDKWLQEVKRRVAATPPQSKGGKR